MENQTWYNAKAKNYKTGEIVPAFDDMYTMALSDEHGNLLNGDWGLYISHDEFKGNIKKISIFIAMSLALTAISILANNY